MSEFTTIFSTIAKFCFLICILLQVMMWPSVASICFACVYGIVGISYYFSLNSGNVMKSFLDPGVYIFRSEKNPRNFIFMFLMSLYFIVYFILFIGHSQDIMPSATFWLDKSFAANYSSYTNTQLPVGVTSDVSKKMRGSPFIWSRNLKLQAPLITGIIPSAGPSGGDLLCNTKSNANISNTQGFKCFAKLWQNLDAPEFVSPERYFVPISSDFYNVDVMVSPGAGKKCSDLEVYRLVINHERSIIQPMDYPASTVPLSSNAVRSPLHSPACGLFNGSDDFCLQTQHTFTKEKYAQEVSSLCDKFNQKLIFRLPMRTVDVDPDSGRYNLDIFLVSDSVEAVELHASWKHKNQTDWYLFFSIWEQVVDSDLLQDWRESTTGGDVFFKFLIAVFPLMFTWYHLSSEYIYHFLAQSQVIFISVFIQLPSILLFLSMGAWLPMAGCIVCVLAVNHEVSNTKKWIGLIRPSLLFLTAVCNSIQFVWILALIGEAGWNAFYYSLTLDQIYTISYKFIITNQSSPTWIALMLPIILMINASFLIGSAICVVLEGISKTK
jgi:hypothetical protein